MKELVIFDVDDTIIKGQSQRLFLKFLRENKHVSFFYYLKVITWFIFYKLGLVDNPRPPMEYAFSFVKGKTVEKITEITDDFFDSVLKNKIYPEVLNIIQKHQEQGREVILISNAADVIIRRVAAYLGVTNYLSTKLETVDNMYTGRIIGDIMYGRNKCKALKDFAEKNGFDLKNSWSYADHDSDIPLFLEITHPCAVNPTKKLQKMACDKKWPILNFRL